MNEKIRPDEFRESMDRCLSGVKADPFLAGRVIASKEGETGMKKKLSLSLVFALVALLALGTVAYSATRLFRSVNMKGEVVSTEPPSYEDTDFFYGSGMSAKETKELVEHTAMDVPDDVFCQAWYSSPKDGATYLSTHPRMKKFTSYEEFLESMAGIDYLTLPAQLPEDYASFYAEIHMDCAYGYPLELLEEGENGPVRYVRYTYDESASVITGYILIFHYEDQSKDIHISASLSGHGPESYILTDTESSDPVTIQGMDEALMLTMPGHYSQLHMERRFDWEKQIRIHAPKKYNSDESDNGFYRYEHVIVSSHNRSPEELLKIFNGNR
ncbi:MAG: hypothetical protein IKZ98_13895 [Clostridia bacterium]|nr:hypothetical protein [Clostridia bacterium]